MRLMRAIQPAMWMIYAVEADGLKKPDITVITHWHWDHTFGIHHMHGLSAAHRKTRVFLEEERERLWDRSYLDFLKQDDECLGREYENNKEIIVVEPDIEFEEGLTIRLRGLTAEIRHTVSPHSEDTVLIYIPEEKTLFLGDSTSEDFYNGGYMDHCKLKSLTDVIECTDCQYSIVSHADPLTKQELLKYLGSISE